MLIDLHVHTSRYSMCAKEPAEAILAMAFERGLDAVVLTEHNVIWPDKTFLPLRDKFPGLKIFRGVEIHTSEGEDLLVYGMTDTSPFGENPTTTHVMNVARTTGAAVVLAHPLRYRESIADGLYASPPDACECWSLNICAFQRPGILAFQAATGCGLIAATDSHSTRLLGAYALRFHNPIQSEQDLVHALHNRAYTPFQNDTMLTEFERSLPDRVAYVRRAVAEGLDRQAIHDHIGCSFSFIEHIKAGRYPSLMDEK
ncbi:MAG: hypothetical protein A2498_10670 [Lentisphaerae bacterium RIFOXYC12_FULL_60_16]|nr:MAG: hypothetical protein A2498_10670 [Lentisphaerae bacterium RIFOXYC12_FULL_60_16]OGV86779.1 MAG: hypothetical protein A2340_14075 [Lentisphaerae bacterium RIFOXYB12_FULL_60_10]